LIKKRTKRKRARHNWLEYLSRSRARKREALNAIKLAVGCERCAENDPACLQSETEKQNYLETLRGHLEHEAYLARGSQVRRHMRQLSHEATQETR